MPLPGPSTAVFPAVLLMLFLVIAWLRRPETRAVLAQLKG